MGIFVLIVPLVAAVLFWSSSSRKLLHTINAAACGVLLFISVWLTGGVVHGEFISYPLFNRFFYVDALSAILLDIITGISLMVGVYAMGYLNEEYKHGILTIRKIRIFYSLNQVFIFTMILAVTTRNLGVMWIAIEATTLASAFLVGFYNNKYSIEAAWKYIIICSVGIALALLGIVLLHLSSVKVFHDPGEQLSWVFYFQNANRLDSSLVKIAFIFILIGFGTKMGLAPMHTWLPDAHSQAPSPASAMLSGVLLNSALYGIIRVLAIVNKNLGNSFYTGRLLIFFGLLSIGTAAVFILPQKDYKRLLAYSSIEHMGIMAFALGIFSPAAIFGALFHMINHACTKSMLFLASGNVYIKYNTREISKVRGVLKILPISGAAFLLGLFAIAGMPPFSVFSSELMVIISSFGQGHFIQGGLLVLLVAIVFAGIASSLLKIFYGGEADREVRPGEINIAGTAVILILLLAVFVTGLYMPQSVRTLLESAGNIIMGVS